MKTDPDLEPQISMFLSKSELTDLTGLRHPTRQASWLKKNGWPFHEAQRPGHRPLVPRDYAYARITGISVRNVHADALKVAEPRPLPNFDAFRRAPKK